MEKLYEIVQSIHDELLLVLHASNIDDTQFELITPLLDKLKHVCAELKDIESYTIKPKLAKITAKPKPPAKHEGLWGRSPPTVKYQGSSSCHECNRTSDTLLAGICKTCWLGRMHPSPVSICPTCGYPLEIGDTCGMCGARRGGFDHV
jgi:hypothetical protein